MTRAFSNNLYIVMIFDSTETNEGIIAQKAMVQQVDAKPIKNHWREMNRIKNELFGEEKTAIEYYPAKSRLIDEHDIYWLWIFEEGVLPTYN